jgi:signal peptidase I
MPNNFLRFIVFTAVVLGVLVGALRLTSLRWWKVPEDDPDLAASVAPTLSPGDWLILWRATAPGFGDLVLCPDPEDPSEIFVGRIAGEPGDSLQVDDAGAITVNNSRMRSEVACDPPSFRVANPRSGDEVELRCDIEALGGVRHPRALVPPTGVMRPSAFKREIEPGAIFLVSDNRLYPFDSRDFGSLPKASCKEAIIFRLVSRLGFSDVKARLSWIR